MPIRRDSKGRFSGGGGSGVKGAAKSGGSKGAATSGAKTTGKSKTPNYKGLDYKGKEGKSFVVSDGTITKYLNNKEFGEFSRQKLGYLTAKGSASKVGAPLGGKQKKTRIKK